MNQPQIVYIAGISHSGSTLLTMLLGTHSQLFAGGELKVLSPSFQANAQEKPAIALKDRRVLTSW